MFSLRVSTDRVAWQAWTVLPLRRTARPSQLEPRAESPSAGNSHPPRADHEPAQAGSGGGIPRSFHPKVLDVWSLRPLWWLCLPVPHVSYWRFDSFAATCHVSRAAWWWHVGC